jgi:hypothetical protein
VPRVNLFADLVRTLSAPGRFRHHYPSEAAFEDDVWELVRTRCRRHWPKAPLSQLVLTSHKRNHGPAERQAWLEFLRATPGPDVRVLGSNNRLDIVVRPSTRDSIGIEVKCLASQGHAAKLTQGLGQALLALGNRRRTLLLIHCGSVPQRDRDALRRIARRICRTNVMCLVVVP